MTDVERNLSETWGDPAPFSDYKPGESISNRDNRDVLIVVSKEKARYPSRTPRLLA